MNGRRWLEEASLQATSNNNELFNRVNVKSINVIISELNLEIEAAIHIILRTIIFDRFNRL